MGRKRVTKTEEKIMAQEKKWWGPKRNAKRRKKYAQDAEYRERKIKAASDYYKEKNPCGPFEGKTCLKNLGRLNEIGTVRTVEIGGVEKKELTFTIEELAKALDRSGDAVWRWRKAGLLPGPTVHAMFDPKKPNEMRNQYSMVYLGEEIDAMVRVLGELQKETAYYKTNHKAERDVMFEMVEAVRRSHGVEAETERG